ncbi:glycoside hydrolase family 88 protein [Paenibacillus sonchi]|uniref:Glycoside hydrolase family 88 protein n=1 Tax=Paenibacillus sonchi TaxID=373687 RepID=A0A974PCE7_9BACL|nr:glycoside hydrolase family 88 protein [Paenibacillus sonchi]QQZ61305.1 glycoside hydrolase family 88 protein [Paenibacillus sonchi]
MNLNPIEQFVLERIDGNLLQFTDSFPAASSHNLIYSGTGNVDWTTGFWNGILWLAYEATNEEKYRKAAEHQLASFRHRVEGKIETDTHDLGFLYSLSAVAAYRITGNAEAKEMALKAADLLTERYFDTAGIIQAWGNLQNPVERGRMIIDCLMNLPLLYWAASETGNVRYAEMAHRHAKQSAAYLVRPDHSTYHTFYMDPISGAPKYGNTHQGYADDSCWARGQAWGIYGFTLSYVYTGDISLLQTAKAVTDYFVSHLPVDKVVFWDLVFKDGDNQERDSSAAAIAICGMLEMVKHLPADDTDKLKYTSIAHEMLESLSELYTTVDHPKSNGLLKHGVYNKPRGWGIDECTIWGDYFFLEALLRIRQNLRMFW